MLVICIYFILSAVAIRFVQGSFVDRYDPSTLFTPYSLLKYPSYFVLAIEDLYRKIISVDDHNFMLEIMDTAGTVSFVPICL